MFPRYNAPDSDESGCESDYAESSGSSSSSSASIGSTSKVINRMRNLSLNQVLCMDVAEEAGDQSQAAANGKSIDRIKQSMKKPCCNKRCKRNLMFKTVFAFCIAFWSLSKSGQDCLLLGLLWETPYLRPPGFQDCFLLFADCYTEAVEFTGYQPRPRDRCQWWSARIRVQQWII